MTERLYYTDSHILDFNASVLDIVNRDGKYFVRLDRTAFYPTSGGQLFDTGYLSTDKIFEVVEESGDIYHVLLKEPAFSNGDKIIGRIDWTRRRDNMQKHTGQHMLSQAFIQVCQAETISARLGEEDSTIDLNCESIGQSEIERAEELANQIIFEDRSVAIEFVSQDELNNLPLRKIPDRQEGKYRIIVIEDYDWSACGGTHCRSTGSVGIIKITGQEKIRGNIRLHFLTGLSALFDYRWRFDQIETLAKVFTRHGKETLEAVQNLIEENKRLRRQSAELRKELLPAQAEKWYQNAREIGGQKVIALDLTGDDFKEVKETVVAIISKFPVLVLAGCDDKIMIGASSDISLSASDIIDKISTSLGGKGGGSPQLAQGGGFKIEDVKALIANPEIILRD